MKQHRFVKSSIACAVQMALRKPKMVEDKELARIERQYIDLRMLLLRIVKGYSYKDIGKMYGVTTRATRSRIQIMGSEMLRQAFEKVKGDPDHPATDKISLDQFNNNPRFYMRSTAEQHVAEMEKIYRFSFDFTGRC